MEYLRNQNLLPTPIFPGARGKVSLFDFNAFAELAIIGLVQKLSPSIIYSAKLAKAVVDVLTCAYSQVPFGRGEFDRLLLNKGVSLEGIFNENGEVIPLKIMELLKQEPDLYDSGKVMKFDYRLLILNGRHVLSITDGVIAIHNGVHAEGRWWAPEFVIKESVQGSDTVITHLHELSGDVEEVKREFEDAFKNIETRVEINLSLAIRNALDAVVELRKQEMN